VVVHLFEVRVVRDAPVDDDDLFRDIQGLLRSWSRNAGDMDFVMSR